ncbi:MULTISPECIES: hypothetical protein [unclassified Acidiplasma]|nr:MULTISPECIES: hypothetical protein [unclassified Acidiplasma]
MRCLVACRAPDSKSMLSLTDYYSKIWIRKADPWIIIYIEFMSALWAF